MQLSPRRGVLFGAPAAKPRGLSFFGALAFAALAGLAAMPACGGDSGGGSDCEGGVVVDGRCEGKCTPEKCVEGNTCVGNRCVLQCASTIDCFASTQDCLPAKEDDTGKAITTCQANLKAPFGLPCYFNENGTACDMVQRGDGTVGALSYCPNGDQCDYAQCGGEACEKNEEVCDGVEGCVAGLCPDGKACVVPSCSKEECQVMTCFSSGVGDAGSFCTRYDCHGDDECAPGFYCGVSRDSRDVCGEGAGNPNICGLTDEACVDKSELGAGKDFEAGTQCLLRRACLPRRQCDTCETDADCRFGTVGTKCVKDGPDNRCIRPCKTSLDCDPDHSCDGGLCVSRSEYGCIGKGKFCDPCDNDLDCGSPGSNMVCLTVYANMKACRAFDFDDPETCEVDEDCPVAASGLHGHCLGDGDADYYPPGAYGRHHCVFPTDLSTNKESCWPSAEK